MLAKPGEFSSNLDCTRRLRPIAAINAVWHGRRRVCLVIVEWGSHFQAPAGLGARSVVDDEAPQVVIAQGEEEAIGTFATRVVRLILELERSRQNIERAILCIGPHFEADAAGARRTIARALITHSVTARGESSALVLERAGDPGDDLLGKVS